jgi:hypothetical protein
MNDDFVRFAVLKRTCIHVDPQTIFYQPLHTLPAWTMICNSWVDNGGQAYSYPIDLKGLDDVTWESLGHKGIDAAKPQSLTNRQRELLAQLKAEVIFHGRPRVIDVERGLWDVNAPRELGRLSAAAPRVLKDGFCKTTKFLMCWRFEIVLTLPEEIRASGAGDVSVSFLRVPLARDEEDGRKLRFSSEETNYPWIMAALALVV